MAANEDFTTNMLRMVCGALVSSISLQASREMFGKSYFSLGMGERAILDQAVFAMLAANFQSVTPENLATQATAKPVGFQAQQPQTEKK